MKIVYLEYFCVNLFLGFKPMRYLKQLFILFLFLLGNSVSSAQKVSIVANVSHQPVVEGEDFQVVYTINNAVRGIDFLNPNFVNFTLLSGPNRGSSTEIVMDNTGMKKNELVTYSFVLRAKQTGTFQIKGAAVRVNGERIGAPNITVKVVSSSAKQHNDFPDFPDDDIDAFFKRQQQLARKMLQQMRDFQGDQEPLQEVRPNASELTIEHINDNIFLKAEVDKLNPMVGEQVNVTYKLYTRLGMSMQPAGVPQLNGFWAKDDEVKDMGQAHQENYHGRLYNVFTLKKTALFPQKSGQLTIDPFKASGWVNVLENNGYSYVEKRVEKELQSQTVVLNVKPLPASPPSFTGGVGIMNLMVTTPKANLTTDDVIQLKLKISGAGNLDLVEAPKLVFPSGLNSLEPEIKDSIGELMPKMDGYREFTYNLNANAAGSYTIPSFDWTYFNTDENAFRTITINPITIVVDKGSGKAIAVTSTPQVNKFNEIINLPLIENSGAAPLFAQWYFWGLVLLPLVFFGGLSYKEILKQSGLSNHKNIGPDKIAQQRLAKALGLMNSNQNAEFYEEISKAIWLYLSEHLQIPLSNLNKQNLEQSLQRKGLAPQLINDTLNQIEHCERSLYSPFYEKTGLANSYQEVSKLIQQFEDVFKRK